MRLIKLWKDFWNRYMKAPMEEVEGSSFPKDEIKRYQIIFSGVVQGVGFRYETWMIAKKLELTGFAENLANGDVRVEIQGQQNKIDYCIAHLQSIPRIHIEKIKMVEIELKKEDIFEAIY